MQVAKPKLRWPLEIQHHSVDDQPVVVLKCQYGIAKKPAVIPLPLLAIVARLDGAHSVDDIVREGAESGVTAELVQDIINELERMSFLDTPETQATWQAIQDDYKKLAKRPAALVDAIYPGEADVLERLLERYIAEADAAGFDIVDKGDLVAMMCPHIDYKRGWQTYCAAYRALEALEKPDVIFLFGTSHQPGQAIFRLTRKAFETPLGTFPAASAAIDALAAGYGETRAFADEIVHRTEHSLELQLPFMAYRYQGGDLPAIVPVLVGSFDEHVRSGVSPNSNEEVEQFVDSLVAVTEQLISNGKRVLFYGGVDLAHVGLNFGDEVRVSDGGLEQLELEDRELLGCLLRADEQGLFAHIARDGDRRRVCGFPSLYTMFATMRRLGMEVEGHELEYRQAVEPQSDTIVTFASLAWTLANA